MTCPELEELLEADQARWNRLVRLVVWALDVGRLSISLGVRRGIVAALSETAAPLDWPGAEALIDSAPGYGPPER